MNNKMPEAPKTFYNYKSKYILAIVFGILSIIIAAIAFIHWSLYSFSIGFAIASLLFALKYYELDKLSIVAVIVSIGAALIIGYSIIRTSLVEISEFVSRKSVVEQYHYNPFEFYDEYFDEFMPNMNNGDVPDYWS